MSNYRLVASIVCAAFFGPELIDRNCVSRSASNHFRFVTWCRDFIEHGRSLVPPTLPANLFEKKSCDDQARDDYPDRGLAQFPGERCGNPRQSNGRCVANRNGEV